MVHPLLCQSWWLVEIGQIHFGKFSNLILAVFHMLAKLYTVSKSMEGCIALLTRSLLLLEISLILHKCIV